MPRLLLPVEEHQHAQLCTTCQGRGVTGQRYEFETGNGHVLLMEVICPECGGCGNGDPEHEGCQPEWHAYLDDDGLYPDDDDEADEGPACYSCGSGRGWFPVEGWYGEGEDTVMVITRMPCGCSEGRLVKEETQD